MKLNIEQKAILEHTLKNGMFCGGGKDMDVLVDNSLMECVGKKSFVPDPYYQITRLGKDALNPIS